jgi:hypothetical protein
MEKEFISFPPEFDWINTNPKDNIIWTNYEICCFQDHKFPSNFLLLHPKISTESEFNSLWFQRYLINYEICFCSKPQLTAQWHTWQRNQKITSRRPVRDPETHSFM